jgi:hypothetical protein
MATKTEVLNVLAIRREASRNNAEKCCTTQDAMYYQGRANAFDDAIALIEHELGR